MRKIIKFLLQPLDSKPTITLNYESELSNGMIVTHQKFSNGWIRQYVDFSGLKSRNIQVSDERSKSIDSLAEIFREVSNNQQ